MRLFAAAIAVWFFPALASAEPAAGWTLDRTAHFEIYSQAGHNNARAALTWFEELHEFFQQAGVQLGRREPIRVIGFRSVNEYDAYRLRPAADAYYIGTDSRDYIVMPALGANEFGVAAHEYAHVVLHAGGAQLPAWLTEGLAEFFSSVRIGDRHCEVGEELPAHASVLRHSAWMPLERLLAFSSDQPNANHAEIDLFYAQSWALTEMLALSPDYRPKFPAFIGEVRAGSSAAKAFRETYGKPLETVESDLHQWLNARRPMPLVLPGIAAPQTEPQSSELSPFAARALMADLVLASGELNRAETMYRDLQRESPGNPDISAALGTVALRQGDRARARECWKEAIRKGIADPELCYRYAVLAEDAGSPAEEVRSALARAIALRPHFDDAHYKLGLLENNAGNFEAGLAQLQAMDNVSPQRAYAYWMGVGYALEQLGRHDEAQAAAQKALAYAADAGESNRARQFAYITQTDLTVQFARDANGDQQMITTRVPRGQKNWNPFIEPGDQIRHADGQLQNVDCGNNRITGISLATAHGSLKLAIPDPLHVLIDGATQFTCGSQTAQRVTVDYAVSTNRKDADGILRGMAIR